MLEAIIKYNHINYINLSTKRVLMKTCNNAIFYSQSELQDRTKVRKCHTSDLF